MLKDPLFPCPYLLTLFVKDRMQIGDNMQSLSNMFLNF